MKPIGYFPNSLSKGAQRSRVTRGRQSFEFGDGRSRWARRFKDLLDTHVADLGGPLAVTELQVAMCRRIATIQVECEKMEGLLSLGEPVNVDLYNRLSGNLRRLCEQMGIKAGAAKDETPDINNYLQSVAHD